MKQRVEPEHTSAAYYLLPLLVPTVVHIETELGKTNWYSESPQWYGWEYGPVI